MSLSRHFLREFRPLFQMLEQPMSRSPASFFPASRSFFDEPSVWETPNQARLAVDVTEHDGAFVVETDLPGVKKEDVQVRIGDNGRSVTIQGKLLPKSRDSNASTAVESDASNSNSESTAVVEESKPTQLTTERSFTGSFTRTVYLPGPVNTGNVRAKLEDGILTVSLQKAQDTESVSVQVD